MTVLATSRYVDFHPSMGVPVGITVGKPKMPLRYRVPAEIDELKPHGRLFQLAGAEFEQAYRAKLDRIGVERLRERFQQIAADAGDDRLVLLCFENVLAGQDCHRRIFAAWWTQVTGESVSEVAPGNLSKSHTPASGNFRNEAAR